MAALDDIDKALTINRNALNAYIMRADIAINSYGDYNRALDDIDQAIKLSPKLAGLYINRAFLRYKTDNYKGAMADYDYALTPRAIQYGRTLQPRPSPYGSERLRSCPRRLQPRARP